MTVVGKDMTEDLRLMKALDGEASREETLAADELVQAGGPGAAKQAAMRQLGELTRARTALAVSEARDPLAALWSRIEARLEASPVVAPVPVPDAMVPARPEKIPAPVPGLLERLRAWLDGARSHLATGAVCAAAGAALALWLAPGPRGQMPGGDVHARGVEVESLEVIGGTGTIFQVPADEGATAAMVIWITPDAEQAI